MLFSSCMNNFVRDAAIKQMGYSEFMDMAKEGKVKAIDIVEAESQIYLSSDKDTERGLIQAYHTGIVSSDTGLAEKKMEAYGVDVNSEIQRRHPQLW